MSLNVWLVAHLGNVLLYVTRLLLRVLRGTRSSKAFVIIGYRTVTCTWYVRRSILFALSTTLSRCDSWRGTAHKMRLFAVKKKQKVAVTSCEQPSRTKCAPAPFALVPVATWRGVHRRAARLMRLPPAQTLLRAQHEAALETMKSTAPEHKGCFHAAPELNVQSRHTWPPG